MRQNKGMKARSSIAKINKGDSSGAKRASDYKQKK